MKYLDRLLDIDLDSDLEIDLLYLLDGEGDREYLNKRNQV